MKKIVICLLLLSCMLAGMLNVYAEEAQLSVQVVASSVDVKVGETVEYTVVATGSGVVALQFELRLPEGLRYVPGSAATPEGLAQKLGIPAAEWTEQSMMFTCYNDVGITVPAGTQLLSFSCIAQQEGNWAAELYQLLPFDGEFQAFSAELQVDAVLVSQEAGDTKPTVPDVPGETEPPVAAPGDPTAPTVTEPTAQVTTQPAADPDKPAEQPSDEVVTEPATGLQDQPSPKPEQVAAPEETEPDPVKPVKKPRFWIFAAVAVPLLACAVAAVVIFKKKHS